MAPRKRFLIAIPAHDEEACIATTVRSCMAVDYPQELFEVLVVADNCADQTAAIASSEGATVLPRFHDTDRSKGHALRFLFDQLEQTGQIDKFDAVVVVDADTVVRPNLLSRLADYLEQGEDWVQAFDTVANACDSWRTRLMAYSFGLINGVFLLGQTAVGLSAALRGNGMCLSTRGLKRFPWKAYGLVEDLEFSWSLRGAGERIAFAPDAVVCATMLVHGGDAAAIQRQRSEYGRRQLKRDMLYPLVRSKHLKWPAKLAAIIELSMPPLVPLTVLLLTSMVYCLCVLCSGSSLVHGMWFRLLLGLVLLECCGLALYGISPFVHFQTRWNVLLGLFYFPRYVLWRISMIARSGPARWIRTPRESAAGREVNRQPPCTTRQQSTAYPGAVLNCAAEVEQKNDRASAIMTDQPISSSSIQWYTNSASIT